MVGGVREARLARWQDRTDEPLLVAALVFLVVYAIPIIHPELPVGLAAACRTISLLVWGLFAADLVVRVALAPRRGRYLLSNWLDVIAVALPMLRPLRVLRAVLALSILGRRGQPFVRGRVVGCVVAAVAGVCGIAALAVLDAERRNPEANIKGIGDALWWSISTVTTVGYGDRFPTTAEGRIVGAALMVTGIALLGVVTAALASWFVERLAEVKQAEEHTESTVQELVAEMRQLREQVARLVEASPSDQALAASPATTPSFSVGRQGTAPMG
jgi:voltage-gated potassium channel